MAPRDGTPAARIPVGTRDHFLGVVTREQLEHWCVSEKSGDPIGSIVEGDFVHVHPDHPLDVVLDRLSESHGLLPVVSRVNVRRVEGVVTPESILALRDGRGTDVSGVWSH